MLRTQKVGCAFALLAALLWSPHYYLTETLNRNQVSVLVVQFHVVFWAAVGLLVLLLLSGRLSELRVFYSRETHFVVMAVAGGYAFWMFYGVALRALRPGLAQALLATMPMLTTLMASLTAERADGRAWAGVLLGFIGALVAATGIGSSATAGANTFGGHLAALAAAACWALLTVMARPIVREENALPVAALVTGIGALCLFVTCLSAGDNVFDIRPVELRATMISGFFTVGLMTALWVKSLGALSAFQAAAFWYLSAAFSAIWALKVGQRVSPWLVLAGTIIILIGISRSLSGRQRNVLSMADIMRGTG